MVATTEPLGRTVGKLMKLLTDAGEAADMDYMVDYGEWSASAGHRALQRRLRHFAIEHGYATFDDLYKLIEQRTTPHWAYFNIGPQDDGS